MAFPRVPVTTSNMPDWVRKVATSLNLALGALEGFPGALSKQQQFPYAMVTEDPADPVEGQAWYRSDLHKAFVFDGTSVQGLW